MSVRKKICAGNWKMYKTPAETRDFLRAWFEVSSGLSCQVVVFPPALNLSIFQELATQSRVEYGAQNIYFAKDGAFTGENSPAVVAQMGAQWALIGHSERRTLFTENNELIAKKVLAAFENGLTPMLCVGETLSEREAQRTFQVIEEQITKGLSLLLQNVGSSPKAQGAQGTPVPFVVAYEPVWAIGTGRVATPAQAEEVHQFIRKIIAEKWGVQFASNVSILYGGSVKPDNAADLAAQNNIDGFLVGGASLKPTDFLAIAKALISI